MILNFDRLRMSQVLENLLSNAVKFTNPNGYITISCSIYHNNFLVNVADSGQGLNKADLDNIFKSFTKLSAKPTGGETSTGLGLVIVKKLVNLHGGDVWVESEPGKGSKFMFTIPIES